MYLCARTRNIFRCLFYEFAIIPITNLLLEKTERQR